MADETRPSGRFFAVSKSDTDNLTYPARAIYVGGAGDVAVLNDEGVSVTFVGVAAGTWIPVKTKRVMSTNTDATDMVALA